MSIRARLTGWYAAVFAISALALLAAGYWIVERNVPTTPGAVELRLAERPAGTGTSPRTEVVPGPGDIAEAQSEVNAEALDRTLRQFAIALAIATLLAVGAGWLVAGRALRPIRRISDTARRISHEHLGERIELRGPRDELRELADVIDAMLDRLDRAFGAQRHFAAQAAHELRTPLTVLRTEVELARDSPATWSEEQEEVFEAIDRMVARGEALTERLLVLGRGQQERLESALVDLAELARLAVRERAARDVAIDADLQPAPTQGDAVLLRHALDNLVDNAVTHNRPGGWVRVRTGRDAHSGAAEVEVVNSGPTLSASALEHLVQPFARAGDAPGSGLGLSIVDAVAEAHRAELSLEPGPDGGLRVVLRLPAAGAGPPRRADGAGEPGVDQGAGAGRSS